MPHKAIATQSSPAGHVEVFQYEAGGESPLPSGWDAWMPEDAKPKAPPPEIREQPPAAPPPQISALEEELRADFDRRVAEEGRKSWEAGRERGRQEGRQAEVEALAAERAAQEEQHKKIIAELYEKFHRVQEKYISLVEPEVVHLALAVAARILRREAQMDPLLLTGAVRVALGQLASSTQVRLKVPPGDLDLWTEAMALLPNLAVKPTVMAGEGMLLGDCEIETEMGSVDLGIRAQLSEIERGFFDRAGVRRAAPAKQPESVHAGQPRDGSMGARA